MSKKLPERADLRQLKIQAKELLTSLRENGNSNAKLSDAQFELAKEYGFASWPKLVEAVEHPNLVRLFKDAVASGNIDKVQKLVSNLPNAVEFVNQPHFDFDSMAIHRAAQQANNQSLLKALVDLGADPNLNTQWWAGGFSPLDLSHPTNVEALINLGAKLDAYSAAKLGKADVLRQLIKDDPNSVNAPYGDGQRPLHVASSVETAEILIEAGADVNVRDKDHEGSPIQYQVNNLEIVRLLLKHGAVPDVFIAVALDDVELLKTFSEADFNLHVGSPPFATVQSNGGHIYSYTIGNRKSPLHFAIERGSYKVAEFLKTRLSPARKVVAAAWLNDEATINESTLTQAEVELEKSAIADAAQSGKADAVRLLLKAGFDPNCEGFGTGNALQIACWFGYIEVVRLLVDRVDLEHRDPTHGSNALGWAAHGANHCRNPKGDYAAVVRHLLESGADPHAPANRLGVSMIDQCGNRNDIKVIIREAITK